MIIYYYNREDGELFYYLIAFFIFIFLIVFISFNILIMLKKIKLEEAYTLIVPLLGFFGWVVITLLYIHLSFVKDISFVDSYSFDINNQKAITIGSGEEDGKNTYLTNTLAVESHLSLRFDSNDTDYIGTLELLTDKRKAIVNKYMLQNISETENSIRERLEIAAGNKNLDEISEVEVRNGDFIRIGYSNYEISRDGNVIELENVSLNFWSPVSMFYLYTTTTYPDIVIGEQHGVETMSIWWIWLITSIVMILFTMSITVIILKIFSKDNKINSIVHPVLYFSVFLEFLLVASFINFTIMFFYQFNHYEKGSLFTELVVFTLIFVFSFVGYTFLHKARNIVSKSVKLVGFYMGLLAFFILITKDSIYSSVSYFSIPKDMLIFFGEQVFLFFIFILFFNFLSKDKSYLFGFKKYMNNDIYKDIFLGSLILIVITLVLSLSKMIHEGQGMVFIESAKFFTFLLLTLLLHSSFQKNFKEYLIFIIGFIFALLFTIGYTKDKGSILQVVLVLGLLYILLKDGYSLNIKNRFLKIIIPLVIIGLIALISYFFYTELLRTNIRFAMWIEPFEQSIEPSTQYFMYRYEQLARGLFLIKSSGLFSSDFINSDFLPLPAIHTDFIFAFYSNVFGYIGVIALVVALIMISQAFKSSIGEYSKTDDETFKFLYVINSVFITYMLSYYIINMASVLQIIPLTDVPLPFLTYSKGILVFFTMLYLFVIVFNMNYLEHKKGD